MDTLQLAGILVSIFAFGGVGVLIYNFSRGATAARQQAAGMRGLMSTPQGGVFATRSRADFDDDDDAVLDIETIKERAGRTQVKKTEATIEERLFHAGIYSPAEKRKFYLSRIIFPVILGPCLGFVGLILMKNPAMASLFGLLGAAGGFVLPSIILDKKIAARQEVTLYYLPLVIEQISIGVSSSLDIGPCISMLVEMADERDSHNPVTEMFIHCEKLMRSGLSLEESLIEVAEANGQHEVKHAFLFLAQCAKHGGEISKQLQELADAVMVQRQTYVEGRIASLPVKATGPLAAVFAGFFGLLFAGLMVRLMEAFGG